MRTDTIRSITLIIALLTATLLASQFSALALATPPEPARQPHILVRIHSLTATGPDGASYRLFSSEKGFITTLDGLGRVGSQVSGQDLADGAYHTLYVELNDEYESLEQDGSRRTARFSENGKPTTLRVRGMILVERGKATPLRMLDTPSHYGYPKGFKGDDEARDDD